MKHTSDKRAGWLDDYRRVRNQVLPDECARCRQPGSGWKDKGGDFEPHHPFLRGSRWATCTFIPLCGVCHKWVHDHGAQARQDGWIVEPRQVSNH